ncbi:MAG: hypothetical protein Q9208_000860 [Pyrenodesmia sp. 3 TL-2023]
MADLSPKHKSVILGKILSGYHEDGCGIWCYLTNSGLNFRLLPCILGLTGTNSEHLGGENTDVDDGVSDSTTENEEKDNEAKGGSKTKKRRRRTRDPEAKSTQNQDEIEKRKEKKDKACSVLPRQHLARHIEPIRRTIIAKKIEVAKWERQ